MPKHGNTAATPFTPDDRCGICIWYAVLGTTGYGKCHLNPPDNYSTYGYPLVTPDTDYCKYGEK